MSFRMQIAKERRKHRNPAIYGALEWAKECGGIMYVKYFRPNNIWFVRQPNEEKPPGSHKFK